MNGIEHGTRFRSAARLLLVGGLILAATSASARAQGGRAALERFERQLEQIRRDTRMRVEQDIPAAQRARVEYGGYLSHFFLAIDDTLGETHMLRQTDMTLFGRVNLDGVHQFFVRGRGTYRDFNAGDDFDGDGDELIGPELERGVYRFDLARAAEAYEGESLGWNFEVEAGRQLVHWGNGLTLSSEIDGAQFALTAGPFEGRALVGTSYEEQTDLDSSRPGFTDDMHRAFYGGMLRYNGLSKHTPYVFGLVQRDHNDDDGLTFGANTTNFEYDSHYIGGGVQGAIGQDFRYGVEGVFEGGENLSFNPGAPQTTEDIEAWAVDARLEYLLGDDANTRFSAEVTFASGDDDRAFHTTNTFGGNTPGTDDEAFNGFGLLNTGYAFAPNVSNLAMVRLGASSYPLHGVELFRRLQLGADVLIYNKMDSDAPIDEPLGDTGERYLGTEADFYANWQLTSDLSVVGRYGVFFPSDAIAEDKARHFFYSGVTLAF